MNIIGIATHKAHPNAQANGCKQPQTTSAPDKHSGSSAGVGCCLLGVDMDRCFFGVDMGLGGGGTEEALRVMLRVCTIVLKNESPEPRQGDPRRAGPDLCITNYETEDYDNRI